MCVCVRVLRQVRSNALYDTLWLRCGAVCAARQMTVVRGVDGRVGVRGRGYGAGYACGLWRIDGTTNRHTSILMVIAVTRRFMKPSHSLS